MYFSLIVLSSCIKFFLHGLRESSWILHDLYNPCISELVSLFLSCKRKKRYIHSLLVFSLDFIKSPQIWGVDLFQLFYWKPLYWGSIMTLTIIPFLSFIDLKFSSICGLSVPRVIFPIFLFFFFFYNLFISLRSSVAVTN